MRLNLVFGVIAMLLVLAFLGPMVFKLKEAYALDEHVLWYGCWGVLAARHRFGQRVRDAQ